MCIILAKSVVKKEAITSSMLVDLCEKHKDSNDLLVVRDLCMIVLAYSGFLRFDELHSLHCTDINFFPEYFLIYIRKSKVDQYHHGDKIVASKGHTVACPYAMLQRYLKLAGLSLTQDVFLFRPCFRSRNKCKLIYKNKPLSYTRVRECLVSHLHEVAGTSNIGLHSLHARGASAVANSDRCWKRHGRWKGENSKDGYVADSLSRRLTVSQSLNL